MSNTAQNEPSDFIATVALVLVAISIAVMVICFFALIVSIFFFQPFMHLIFFTALVATAVCFVATKFIPET